MNVRVEVTRHDDTIEWYGTISVDHLANLVAGECYELIMDDGRKGRFRVNRNTFAGGSDRAVSFRGTGPLE